MMTMLKLMTKTDGAIRQGRFCEVTLRLWATSRADTGVLQANRNLGMIPSLARPLLLAANSLGNKLTDLAIEFVPDSVDRSTVCTPAS